LGLWFQLMIQKSVQVRWLRTPEHPNLCCLCLSSLFPSQSQFPWHPALLLSLSSVPFPDSVPYHTCPVLVSRPYSFPCPNPSHPFTVFAIVLLSSILRPCLCCWRGSTEPDSGFLSPSCNSVHFSICISLHQSSLVYHNPCPKCTWGWHNFTYHFSSGSCGNILEK